LPKTYLAKNSGGRHSQEQQRHRQAPIDDDYYTHSEVKTISYRHKERYMYVILTSSDSVTTLCP